MYVIKYVRGIAEKGENGVEAVKLLENFLDLKIERFFRKYNRLESLTGIETSILNV